MDPRTERPSVHVWTVNESAQMLRFISLGVDNIITDVPDVLIEVLSEFQALSKGERLLLAFRNRLSW